MTQTERSYGIGDSSYQAAGELEGITRLVDDFYSYMDQLSAAKVIRDMHPKKLTGSRRKLTYFLSGWLGGPGLYAENYGDINIPGYHKYFPIGESEKNAWLDCMQKAIADQPYEESFKVYLLAQLKIPAERIRMAASNVE